MLKVGDIVVTRFSKAKHLKNRVFKIISSLDGTGVFQAVNPKGSLSQCNSWSTYTLEEVERFLEEDIVSAGKQLDTCKEKLRVFREEAKKVDSYFPKV